MNAVTLPILPISPDAAEPLLRDGLLLRPGRAGIESLGLDAARQLQAEVAAGLMSVWTLERGCDAGTRARALRATLVAGERLRAWLDGALDIDTAEQAVDTALWRLQSGDLAASLAMLPLLHLRLHFAAERDPLCLAQAVEQVLGWYGATMTGWRAWHQKRFGPIRCVDWAPEERFCRRLGYRFEDQDHPIEHLMDRLTHMDREWEQLVGGKLRPLVESGIVWRRLQLRAAD